MLAPGQQRREPAAHGAAAGAEVVDHQAAGRRELSPQALHEVARPGGGVGGLTQDKPVAADAGDLIGHRDARASTPATTDAVAGQPGNDARRSRAARRSRRLSSALSSHARNAVASAVGSSGTTSSPGGI